MTIPLCDPRRQNALLKEEIDAALHEVVAGGAYVLGPNVRVFEQEMAAYLGCRHAVGVGSGTDALHLALRALGIGPGDEVITTPFTFIATTEAIGLVGATPVFADIDPATYNLDPQQIERAITPRTKALLPVHLYGQPCDMDAILAIADRHGLPVVEDNAQALGATYRGRKTGAIGTVGCLSFFPSKNLGCLGDGGMVVTDDPEIYERVEMLRRHGGKIKYHHSELGLNSRLDEIQAALLRTKLPHLEGWNRRRREHAHAYNRLLQTCPMVEMPAVTEHGPATAVYHQYTIEVERRERVIEHLRDAGVGCAVYYPVPLHLQEVHRSLGHQPGDFPHAERAAAHCLSLPMFPELSGVEQQRVATVLEQALAPQVDLPAA